MSSGEHQTSFGVVGTCDVRLVYVNAKHFFSGSGTLALQVVPPPPSQEHLGTGNKKNTCSWSDFRGLISGPKNGSHFVYHTTEWY